MKLISNRYGKARVRVLKVFRDGPRHDLKEAEVSVLLEGDFASSYTGGDNSLVVATDTMKNTVYALAKNQLGNDLELFGRALGEHFLSSYSQVSRASIRLVEHPWNRLSAQGQPQSHAFVERGRACPFAEVNCGRDGARIKCDIESGIEDLLILKSTGSG